MAKKEILKNRLKFRQDALEELYKAYTDLAKGKVQQYTIGSRSLTKYDISKIMDEIKELEKEIDVLEGLLNGGKKRKAVGIIPRDI